MNKKMDFLIDLKMLFDELLKLESSKKYKKEFKGIKITIEGMKKVLMKNKTLITKQYKVKDFMDILKFNFDRDDKDELEYEFLRKSESTQELVIIKEDDEYMVIYYLKKLLIVFVYEKFKKLMGRELIIEECFEELKNDISEEVGQALTISMIIYSMLHKVDDVTYFNKIDELYIKTLEKKIQTELIKNKRETEKEEIKLKKALADLEVEREDKKEANNKVKDLKKKNSILSDDNKNLIRALTTLENKIKQPIELTKKVKDEIKDMVVEERNLSLEKVFESSLNNLNKKFLAERLKNEKLLDKVEILNNEIDKLNKEVDKIKIQEISVTLLEEEVKKEFAENLEVKDDNDEKEILRFFAKIVIEDNRHYLSFNGGEYEFKIEREDKYYVQGEIVLINGNKKIVEHTNCYDDRLFSGLKYGILCRDFEGVYVTDAYGNKIFDVEDNDTLTTASIIGYNSDLNIKVVFKKIKDNIDLYSACIEAKKHKPLIVTNIISGNLFVRNALTGKEEIINIEDIDGLSKEIIDIEQLLVVNKENKFIGIIDNRAYYTYSKNYENTQTIVVKYINSIAYGEKSNGEQIKLNYCNRELIEEGAVCKIDEFNNILYETENKLMARYILKESKINNSTGINENVEIFDQVAIVGRTTYKDTYKLAFLKKGIDVNFVDGNDNYARVQQGLKDIKKIIVCINGVSHGNMWSIKEHYKDRTIIYADSDGANRLYNEYLKMIRK